MNGLLVVWSFKSERFLAFVQCCFCLNRRDKTWRAVYVSGSAWCCAILFNYQPPAPKIQDRVEAFASGEGNVAECAADRINWVEAKFHFCEWVQTIKHGAVSSSVENNYDLVPCAFAATDSKKGGNKGCLLCSFHPQAFVHSLTSMKSQVCFCTWEE